VARRVQGPQRDLELAGIEGAAHLLLAEDEALAVDAGAAQMGVVGTEAQLPPGAAQLRFDQGGDGSKGLVVNRQRNRVVAGVRDELRRRVFDHAFFGFFGFPFFRRDFSAELDIFFVFDRAAVFFGFFSGFAFVFRFAFVFFFGDRGGEIAGEDGQAHRVRRGDGGEQREQQQDQQERKELAHRPFIGEAAALL
jgi:hypothetical protein